MNTNKTNNNFNKDFNMQDDKIEDENLCDFSGFKDVITYENDTDEKSVEIKSTLATFKHKNLKKGLIQGCVIYFWKSHNDPCLDKEPMQATIDALYRFFDIPTCEKYEINTGYLSRYNFLNKFINECTQEDIQIAVNQAMDFERNWEKTCGGLACKLGFHKYGWKYYTDLPQFKDNYEYVHGLFDQDLMFKTELIKAAKQHTQRRKTIIENNVIYLLEEIAWLFTIADLHKYKTIYLTHVGNSNAAIDYVLKNFVKLKNIIWFEPIIETRYYNTHLDFILNYKKSLRHGYSKAVEDGYSKLTQQLIEEINYSVETLQKQSNDELINIIQQQQKYISKLKINNTQLKTIIDKLPGHIYWQDSNLVYLGCNENLAHSFGFLSSQEIIGKTNEELLTSEEARKHEIINMKVMAHKKTYFIEEKATMSNNTRYYLSQKSPLMSTCGKPLGIMGVSMDITERKKSAELLLQNKLQKTVIEKQKQFKLFIEQIAHDIMSPIATISMLLEYNKEQTQIQNILKFAIKSIQTGAEKLLTYYNTNDDSHDFSLFISISESIKQLQYRHKHIKINFEVDQKNRYKFINGDHDIFIRMITNLINNSVDAYNKTTGVINIKLFDLQKNCNITTQNEDINQSAINDKSMYENAFIDKNAMHNENDFQNFDTVLQIQDFGIGMNQDLINNLLNGKQVSQNKANGHGLGFSQINAAVKLLKSTIDINSVQGNGTIISLKFKTFIPSYIEDRIILKNFQTIMIIDSSQAVHSFLRITLNKFNKTIKQYKTIEDAENDFNQIQNFDNLLILCEINMHNALAFLQKAVKKMSGSSMKIYILTLDYITAAHDAKQLGINILPKQFLSSAFECNGINEDSCAAESSIVF